MATELTTTTATHLERTPRELSAVTLEAFLHSKANPNTRAAYRGDLRELERFLEGLPPGAACTLLEATRQHLDGWRENMAQSLTESGAPAFSAATVARRLSSASSFYRYCVTEELLRRNPAEHVERPRVDDSSPSLGLDRGQLEHLYRAAYARGLRDYALALLLAECGLRVSEALQLRAEPFDTEQGHAVVRVWGKGGKVAPIPLPPPVARTLEQLRLEVGDDGGPLFRTRTGRPMSRHDAARASRATARAAGIAGNISPHSLRHTFVTLSLEAGVPLERVQDSARHSDPRTTQRYNRARGLLDHHAAYTLATYIAHPEELTHA